MKQLMHKLAQQMLAGVVLCLLALSAYAQQLVAVPPLTSPVTDQVGMLAPAQRQALENVLKEYESRTGSQIAILLIDKTEPEAIEQYSIRVAEAWKIGRKSIDDGAILVVAKSNPPALRRLRIEAGRGVQGTLTDAQSKRILQDVIAPHFRQNDFYGGLAAGVSAITTLLDKEHFPAPAANDAGKAGEISDDGLAGWLPVLFFIFIMIMMMRARSRGMRRGLDSNRWGRSSGVILGTGIGSGGFGGIGGFGGYSGGGGFGSGGGGFSGGGGTFDGGGASGDW